MFAQGHPHQRTGRVPHAWAYSEGVDEAEKKADAKASIAGPAARKTRAKFYEAVEAYLDAGRYCNGINEALNHFGNWWCEDILPSDVQEYARAAFPGKPASQNVRGITPVKSVLNFAAARGWRAPIRIAPFPYQSKKRKGATFEWSKQMRAFLAKGGVKYHGLAEMQMLGELTGHRVDEMFQMLWCNTELEARSSWIDKSKAGQSEPMEIAIPEELVPALYKLKEEQKEYAADKAIAWNTRARFASGRVFGWPCKNTVFMRWSEACSEAGIEGITPHQAMRHTFATRLHNELGWSANDIAKAGRWKSVELVQKVYIYSDKTTKKAADELSALGAYMARTGMTKHLDGQGIPHFRRLEAGIVGVNL